MFEKRNDKADKEQGLQDEFMETSRSIAVKAKNIREHLNKIKTDKDTASRKKLLEDLKPVIRIKEGEIDDAIGHARKIFRPECKDPVLWATGRALGDDYGDQISRISDKWDEFKMFWDRIDIQGPSPDNQKSDLEIFCEHAGNLDKLLCSIISHSNLVTIPSRLNECLCDLWPGQSLNFYTQFNDELCRQDCGRWFLEYYNSHPAIIDGVVNTADGTIIKVSPNKLRRLLSFIMVAFTAILGIVLAWYSAWILVMMKFPLTLAVPNGIMLSDVMITTIDLSKLDVTDYPVLAVPFAVCYGLIVAGAVTHLLIGALKQQRKRKPSDNLAIEGWLRWFHVFEIKNFFASFSLCIGFFGLILLIKTTDYLTAFLIGYSIDSFVDVFLNRFDQGVSSGTAELKATITINEDELAASNTKIRLGQ